MNRIRKTPVGYEQKFADFTKMCTEAKAKGISQVVVAYPWVIGDNYDEAMESLSRLAEHGLALHIAKPMSGK